jgi:hypothetical protein
VISEIIAIIKIRTHLTNISLNKKIDPARKPQDFLGLQIEG